MLLVREGSTYEPAECGIQSSASNRGIIEHFIRDTRFLSVPSSTADLAPSCGVLGVGWGWGDGAKAALNPAFLPQSIWGGLWFSQWWSLRTTTPKKQTMTKVPLSLSTMFHRFL